MHLKPPARDVACGDHPLVQKDGTFSDSKAQAGPADGPSAIGFDSEEWLGRTGVRTDAVSAVRGYIWTKPMRAYLQITI